MRHVSAKALGLIGGTGAAVIAAVLVLVLASGGTAAGKNICANPSMTSASCVTELAAPHFISPGADALSVTKFRNEASGTTATHVVIAVNFSPSVDVKVPITLLVNGSPADVTGCTSTPAPLPATGVSTVSCPVGNIAGGGTAKMTVRFTTSASVTLTGTATYGEGSGTPGQPTNSVQGDIDPLTVSSDANGGCFDLGPTDLQTVTGSIKDPNTHATVQETDATVGKAGDNSLPCTFIDAGVLSSDTFAFPGTLKSQISFVEFPFVASGLATVKILFTPLPTGVNLNKLKLLEDTNYKTPFFKTYVTVPDCDKKGNIPAPVGVPAPGATDNVAHPNDSCIFNRSPLPGGGGELDLHSIGSPPDSHFGT
jgi:hypothetical protein